MSNKSNAIGCQKAKVTLTKPQESGYTYDSFIVYMSATSLKDVDDHTITTSSGAVLGDNTWGYKIGNSNYYGIPSSRISIYAGEWDSNNTKEVEVSFCAKLSPETVVGEYTSTISFSAISNKEAIPVVFNNITTMQEMTSAICSAATIGDTKSLIDTRDNKTYRVTKLADGYCWMTENLRFGGVDANGNAITITSADSDVTSSFSLTTSTPTGSAYTTSTDWTEGSYIDEDQGYNSRGNNKSEYYPDDSVDSATSMYYGYFYNWYAATAGTGTAEMVSGNATSSICPKGWQLPITSDEVGSKSFANLFYQSGVIANITDDSFATGGLDILTSAPLYFFFSGQHSFYLNNVARDVGDYWSSTVSATFPAYNAYGLGYGYSYSPSYVYTKGISGKTSGASVRCVAR